MTLEAVALFTCLITSAGTYDPTTCVQVGSPVYLPNRSPVPTEVQPVGYTEAANRRNIPTPPSCVAAPWQPKCSKTKPSPRPTPTTRCTPGRLIDCRKAETLDTFTVARAEIARRITYPGMPTVRRQPVNPVPKRLRPTTPRRTCTLPTGQKYSCGGTKG